MFILMSFLVIGVKFEPTSLVNLHGKWTVGLRMKSFFVFDGYSVLWRPWKTFMVGVEGTEISSERRRWHRDGNSDYDYDAWRGSVSIGFYKYFRGHSSFSPHVALSPYFSYHYHHYYGENWGEHSSQTYGVSLSPGIEYFFTLYGKQFSLRFKTYLLSVSRTYLKRYSYEEDYSHIDDSVSFSLPTGGSLSTWLCFHF